MAAYQPTDQQNTEYRRREYIWGGVDADMARFFTEPIERTGQTPSQTYLATYGVKPPAQNAYPPTKLTGKPGTTELQVATWLEHVRLFLFDTDAMPHSWRTRTKMFLEDEALSTWEGICAQMPFGSFEEVSKRFGCDICARFDTTTATDDLRLILWSGTLEDLDRVYN